MASDMAVALARATADGQTLFGHNSNAGAAPALARTPARAFAPGEKVRATHLELPQARQTHAVLGGRCGGEWGYRHGVNDRGVVAGVTAIATRLGPEGPALTGPDLVRLALERAGGAAQAVEVLTDLIARHGQGGAPGEGNSFLVADGREAFVLEACGAHWALQAVPGVRAVSNVCHLRQDWDRISRGLADLAFGRGWWPNDGGKLDFAGALGAEGGDHTAGLKRWVQATLALEQHSGQLDPAAFRRLLQELSDAAEAEASLLVQVRPSGLPLAWCAFGGAVWLPLCPLGELPAALGDAEGGCAVWRQLGAWQAEARRDARLRPALRAALAELQERLDQDAREFAAEAAALHAGGAGEELARLAGSFMQHAVEEFEGVGARLRPGALGGPHRAHSLEEELAALRGGDF